MSARGYGRRGAVGPAKKMYISQIPDQNEIKT